MWVNVLALVWVQKIVHQFWRVLGKCSVRPGRPISIRAQCFLISLVDEQTRTGGRQPERDIIFPRQSF